MVFLFFFFFQAEDGIRDADVTGVQTCALPISILRSNSHTGAVKMLRQGRGDYLLDYRSQVQSALGSLEMEPLPWVPVVELPTWPRSRSVWMVCSMSPGLLKMPGQAWMLPFSSPRQMRAGGSIDFLIG